MGQIVRKLSGHAVLFGVSKSSVLFAPFLAAWLLSKSQYGALEWWLSLSMTIGPIMTLGAQGVVAYGSLGGMFSPYVRAAVIYIFFVCSSTLLFALLLSVVGAGWKISYVSVVALQSSIVVLQLVLSARLKGLGKGAWASLAESALYISLLFSLLLALVGVDFVSGFMSVMIVVESFMLWLLIKVSDLPRVSCWRHEDYKKTFSLSYRFLIGGALMGAFMAGPRLLMGWVSDESLVAAFSIVFRWLSIAIVIHQFINTYYFMRIYGGDPTKRKFAILGCVGLVAISAVVIALTVSSHAIRSTDIPLPDSNDVWLIWSMAGIMILWSTSACLEGVLNSAGRVMSQSISVALGLIVSLIVFGYFYFWGNDHYKLSLTIAWAAGFVSIVVLQFIFVFRARLFS
ncbi:hypothetical protein [Pseudomonas sp. St290]|uniref:hypothetical protein n=1 Tax=Pseudomonas sp. St290 TaxID=1602166 RepID=UPI001BB43E53|nr:hypothetical protein [Pseudomonas sp. St290]